MGKTPQVLAGAGGRGPHSIDLAPRNRQRRTALIGGLGPVARRAAVLLGALAVIVACAAAPARPLPAAVGEIPPPAEASKDGETAAPALVFAEGVGSASHDLAALASLWAEDAEVVETRNTPDAADDYRWAGRDAILDRYRTAVFPNSPAPPVAPPAGAVAEEGDRATLVNGIDAWSFVRRDGRWWIAGLVIGDQ